MGVLEIIAKKRDGHELTDEEIRYLIDRYVAGEIPDYQMSAFLMAAYIRGMSTEETFLLTKAMVCSGGTVDLSGIRGIKVDKHSTGGVGDKVTLILAPLMASVRLKVAKMSGRGLGHTGGTLDKLESIPGFSTELSPEQFVSQVNKIGIAITGQTSEICPADKKLYALRDVTATVSSIPLIASSVMSKKIAGGADVIVLDVKAGSGAFMKTPEEAVKLARELIGIARKFDKKAVAVISNMDQPLGKTVGNALEVMEAIDVLKGFGSPDVLELCYNLGALLMVQAGVSDDAQSAVRTLSESLEHGKALAKFREFVEAQGGDPACVDDPRSILPHARFVEDYQANAEGYVSSVDAELIGVAARTLGAGREVKDATIDLSAGIVMTRKVGDYVRSGDVLLEMHTNDVHKIPVARAAIDNAIRMSSAPHPVPPVFYDIIG